jgi:glycosyltransferase involved in cell wall biosynthesis
MTTPRPTKDVFPTVVLPVSNAARYLASYLDRTVAALAENFDFYEVIVVDDASTDGTAGIVAARQKTLPNITLFRLPRPHKSAIAMIVGLDHAIGDFVVVLNPATDPADLGVLLVREALKGSDIVYALPGDRVDSRGLYNRGAKLFLRLLAWYAEIDLPVAMSSARVFSRAVLNFILKATDRHRILAVAPALSGFSYTTLVYERSFPEGSRGARSGTWRQMVAKSLDLIFAVSAKPLRIVTVFSLAISSMTILYSIYAVFYWFFARNVAPGWTSLSLQISGLFFLMSLVLAVMSEYLQQILDNTERRPLYYVAQQTSSDVMTYSPNTNVVEVGANPNARN